MSDAVKIIAGLAVVAVIALIVNQDKDDGKTVTEVGVEVEVQEKPKQELVLEPKTKIEPKPKPKPVLKEEETVERITIGPGGSIKVETEIIETKPKPKPDPKPVPEKVEEEVVWVDLASLNWKSLPRNAEDNLPILVGTIEDKWNDYPLPSSFASQIEKETCISLKHSKCWTPHAEFKTSREYGFGFGQLTIAYKADGSVRFDNFKAARSLDEELKDWHFDDRYDKRKQMITLVRMNYVNYHALRKYTETELDRLAFMFSAYNGGRAGLVQDINICKSVSGCDPSKWYGNVENHSRKSKVAVGGYGNSFFAINRQYVTDVLFNRRGKYEPFFDRNSHVDPDVIDTIRIAKP